MNEEPVERAPVLSSVLAGAGLVSAAMLATVAIHPYDPFGGRQLVDGFTLATFLAAGCSPSRDIARPAIRTPCWSARGS